MVTILSLLIHAHGISLHLLSLLKLLSIKFRSFSCRGSTHILIDLIFSTFFLLVITIAYLEMQWVLFTFYFITLLKSFLNFKFIDSFKL
jgi:hypothetical protein